MITLPHFTHHLSDVSSFTQGLELILHNVTNIQETTGPVQQLEIYQKVGFLLYSVLHFISFTYLYCKQYEKESKKRKTNMPQSNALRLKYFSPNRLKIQWDSVEIVKGVWFAKKCLPNS